MKNIVIIGGGTGTFTLISGLKEYPANLSVIVSSSDDGGSTGKLRQELGVMPPGDIRQCLLGLSEASEDIKKLFAYRFCEGSLNGHNAGNIIISVLEKITGSAEQAIAACKELLKAKGQVIPVTLKPTRLVATLQNGQKIVGEHNIDEPSGKLGSRIRNLELKPNIKANPRAIQAIKKADVIVFGPGDLHTSILPNLLPQGMTQALAASKAKKVYVSNLMTKHGQTDGFRASDFVKEILRYLGKTGLDTAIINDQKPSQEWLRRYKQEQAEFVWPDISEITSKKIKVVADNFLADYVFFSQPGDKLQRSLLRHDSAKLAKTIWQFITK